MRVFVKVGLATAAFGLLHSALANADVKAWVVQAVGERTAHGLYRPAYNAIAVLSFTALVLYIRRQPVRELYRAGEPAASFMRAGQVAALAYLALGVCHVGLNHLTGWPNLSAWASGGEVPPMPDCQGPAPDPNGVLWATGPFAHTRHPLNWSLIPLFWLAPILTTRRLAFNLVATLYVFVGSIHLEAHLVRAYDPAYYQYRLHVPFFLPGI